MVARDPEWMTADVVRDALRYDPQTGIFVWAKYMNRCARAGQVAGKRTQSGYWSIRMNRKSVMAHRLAWLHVHGSWPVGEIDHVNGQRMDNRISNLRDVGRAVNMQNRRAPSTGTRSGVLGVTWQNGKWAARITVNRRLIQLGRFDSVGEAESAYVAAKRALHEGCTI
jgi:hypothetical protein